MKCGYTKYDIVLVDFGEVEFAGEQGGVRPAIIMQNNKGNKFSGTTIVLPFTSKPKPNLPTHCFFKRNNEAGLKKDSILLGECIRQISEKRIKCKLGRFDDLTDCNKADKALYANFTFQEV